MRGHGPHSAPVLPSVPAGANTGVDAGDSCALASLALFRVMALAG